MHRNTSVACSASTLLPPDVPASLLGTGHGARVIVLEGPVPSSVTPCIARSAWVCISRSAEEAAVTLWRKALEEAFGAARTRGATHLAYMSRSDFSLAELGHAWVPFSTS